MSDELTTPICQSPATKRPKLKRGKLKITQQRVVDIISFTIKTDGVEKARIFFDMLNTYFSTEPGWPETALEVRKLFADIREQEAQEKQAEKEAARKLEELKVTTPSTLIYNTNDARTLHVYLHLVDLRVADSLGVIGVINQC